MAGGRASSPGATAAHQPGPAASLRPYIKTGSGCGPLPAAAAASARAGRTSATAPPASGGAGAGPRVARRAEPAPWHRATEHHRCPEPTPAAGQHTPSEPPRPCSTWCIRTTERLEIFLQCSLLLGVHFPCERKVPFPTTANELRQPFGYSSRNTTQTGTLSHIYSLDSIIDKRTSLEEPAAFYG